MPRSGSPATKKRGSSEREERLAQAEPPALRRRVDAAFQEVDEIGK